MSFGGRRAFARKEALEVAGADEGGAEREREGRSGCWWDRGCLHVGDSFAPRRGSRLVAVHKYSSSELESYSVSILVGVGGYIDVVCSIGVPNRMDLVDGRTRWSPFLNCTACESDSPDKPLAPEITIRQNSHFSIPAPTWHRRPSPRRASRFCAAAPVRPPPTPPSSLTKCKYAMPNL